MLFSLVRDSLSSAVLVARGHVRTRSGSVRGGNSLAILDELKGTSLRGNHSKNCHVEPSFQSCPTESGSGIDFVFVRGVSGLKRTCFYSDFLKFASTCINASVIKLASPSVQRCKLRLPVFEKNKSIRLSTRFLACVAIICCVEFC